MTSERAGAGLHGHEDSIPREYHRKMLKKIAQLTKVIYILNTKNDENERFVARLKATHEEDQNAILSDCTHKLQQCEDKLVLDKDVAERQIVSLRESLLTVERERNRLHEDQSSYRKSVEDKIGGLRAQHSANIQTLTQQLEKLKSEQAQQLKELSQVRADFSKTSSKQVEELEHRYKVKMADLQETLQKEFSREKSALKEDHRKEIESLKAELEEQRREHVIAMTKCSDETAEKRNLEEREDTMRREFSQKEEQLKQQISTLSGNLRAARDKLAVSERRVEDLLGQFEDSKASSSDVQGRLREYEREAELLNSALRESRNELEISREHYQQQSTEMKAMAANLGKLEALAVSNKGTIEKLQSQVEGLQQKNKLLEKERDLLDASRNDTNAHTSAQIMSLQEELDKMRREKHEMRVQYGREIEAAQAQMSESEIHLRRQHLAALQQLQEDSKQAALAYTRDRDVALEELTKKLHSQRDEELCQLKQRLEGENSRLRDNLADRTSELGLAQAELKMLEAELTKREKGLGSAATSLERMREELRAVRGDLTVAHREKQEAVKEKEKFKVTVDGLKAKIHDMTKTHQKRVVELTKELTGKLEKKWKEKLAMECGALRQELSTRHREDSQAALFELSKLHKRDMETARKGWEVEKERLSKRVFDLEKKLQETRNLNSAQLDQAKASSDNQIEALRQELQEQRTRHADVVEHQVQQHRQELEVTGKRLTAEREELVGHLEEKHQQQQLELQQVNQLAVEALRRILEQQNQQMAEQLRSEYDMKMADQQVELMAEYERDKKSLREEGELEIQRHQDQIDIMIANRRNEMSQYEKTVSDLNADVECRDAELSKLRDKANSLTVGVNKLRKELEVKGHELLTVRRETNTVLQQRERELSAAHDVEIESLTTQYKHQSQMLLSQFNNAKGLFVKKTTELESQVHEWEGIYRARDSRPEDVEAIRELRLLIEQQRQKIKDLMAEKKVYQLELSNREKNYNQVFNANPHVGVLNPLAGKQKKPKLSDMGHHFSSAPSLFTSSVSESHSPLSSMSGPLYSMSGPLYPSPASSSTGQLFSRRGEQQPPLPAAQLFTRRGEQQPLPAAKPKKLAVLRDSPLSRHKLPPAPSGREKGADTMKGDGFGLPLKPLDPISADVRTHHHDNPIVT